MSWIMLDDNFPDHPKVAGLSNEAYRLFVDGLCHCGRYRTDGWIQNSAISRLAAKFRRAQAVVDELVTADLWHRDEHDGYIVHEYLVYQLSAKEIDERRQKRAAAGRRGGLRSSEVRRLSKAVGE